MKLANKYLAKCPCSNDAKDLPKCCQEVLSEFMNSRHQHVKENENENKNESENENESNEPVNENVEVPCTTPKFKNPSTSVRDNIQHLMNIIDGYKLPKTVILEKSKKDERESFEKLKSKRKVEFSDVTILKDLNRFIERELRIRYHPKNKKLPVHLEEAQLRSDIKLHIYQEAFLVLVRNFPMVRKLLLSVQEAYDEALEIRNRRLKDLHNLQQTLYKIQKSLEEQKAAIWYDGQSKIADLLKEKIDLMRKVDSITVEKYKQNETIKALDKELMENHRKLLDEIDARRLILYEFNQLNDQMNVLRNKAKGTGKGQDQEMPLTVNEDVETTDDPVVLRIALTKCRQAYTESQAKVQYMEVVYKDVCPLRVHNELLQNFKQLKSDHTKTVHQMNVFERTLRQLEEASVSLKNERDLFSYRLKQRELTGTPRLDWKRCAQFFKGGLEEWEGLTSGKNSNQKFELFLQQLTNPIDFGKPYFVCMGLDDPTVPEFLKYEGTVKNRKYWLRDTRMIIHDIWKNKILENNQGSLQNYFHEFLKQRYHIPEMRAEFAYNLVESCKRYGFDEQVKLFYDILFEEIPEENYHNLRKEVSHLQEVVKHKMEYLKMRKFLTSPVFCDTIRSAFPLKSEMDVIALLEATNRQLKIGIGEDIAVAELFKECEEGLEQKELGKELCDQYRAAQKKYVAEVYEAVLKALPENVSPQTTDEVVTVELLKSVFQAMDPSIEETLLNYNIRWIFNVDPHSAIDILKPITLSYLNSRLKFGNIRKVKYKRSIQ